MKRVTIIAVFTLFTIYSCSTGASKTGDNNKIQTPVVKTALKSQGDAEGAGAIQLTRETFLAKVWDYNTSPKAWKFKGDKPAIIDFYADWCGPCKMASPILEDVMKGYAGKIDFYKVNTDREKELASVFRITSIPAFLYIPAKGKPVMTAGIARTKEDTKKMFIDNIGKYLLSNN